MQFWIEPNNSFFFGRKENIERGIVVEKIAARNIFPGKYTGTNISGKMADLFIFKLPIQFYPSFASLKIDDEIFLRFGMKLSKYFFQAISRQLNKAFASLHQQLWRGNGKTNLRYIFPFVK